MLTLSPKKIALVTGGSRGIGRASALRLARQDYFLYVNYIKQESQAQETLDMVRQAGGEGAVCQADVSDFEAVQDLIRQITKEKGRLDILVNNAGIALDGLLVRLPKENWDRMVATNLTGVFNCCYAAVKPMMKQRWGRIINITSVVAEGGNPGQSGYAATKSGILGFTKSLAKELGGRKICVNAVSPGLIETDITNRLAEQEKEKIIRQIPLTRMGKPEEVAELVAFLASEEAGYITGQVIRIDGGLYM